MGGGSKSQTVGYRYYMGLHMIICYGPVDAVLEFRGADRTAWKGNVTSSTFVNVNAPNLFGGDEKEGGIRGVLDIAMGEPTQMPNDYLEGVIGPGRPAYRGVLGLIFRSGLIAANNPYIKPWAIKVRRILKGWKGDEPWYPEKAEIVFGNDAPPVEIQPWVGSGYDSIDPRNPVNTHQYRRKGASDWLDSVEEVVEEAELSGVIPAGYSPGLLGWSIDGLKINRAYAGDPNESHIGSNIYLHYNQYQPNNLTLSSHWTTGFNFPPDGSVAQCGSFFQNNLDVDSGRFWWSGLFPNDLPDGEGPGIWRLVSSGSPIAFAEKLGSVCTNYPEEGGFFPRVYYSLDLVIEVRRGDAFESGLVAMNPAHIIYQCLTDDEWGMGYDDSILDLDSFTSAADTFHSEAMGLSLLWSRQDTIESFVQVVLDHAGAVLGEDRRTGKILLTPIRGDYDLEDLPHFSDTLGNIVSLQRFERGTPADAINELTVSFTDGLTGKTGGVTVQNLAAIQAAGRVISQSRDYPGFPTIELAARAAMRDLLAATAGLSRWKLTVNRDGYSLLPGKVIKVSWSDDGIVEMPLRVLQVDYGSLTDGKVQLECAEDVFGLPETVYVKPQAPGWTDPSGPPQASPAIAALEVPYRELLQVLGTAETAALASDAGYVAAVAARPPGFSLSFRLYARTGADPFEDVAAGDWCPSGALAASLAPSGATVTLTGASALDRVKVGELAMLGEGVGAELVRIDAIDVGTSTLTLGRGCADTVPRAWPAGTRFWAIDQYGAGSPTEYVEGETVDLKVLSMSGQGLLPELSAPGLSVELAARQVRPYPPGRLRFDDELGTDVAYPVDLVGEITVHWAHRDRLLQHDQLVDASEASIGPEPGTTYTVRYYLDDVLVETESGLTGTSATPYTYSGDGLGRVEVEALRDGHSSWQVAAADFTYFLEEPATRITDAGDIRITDAGDRRVKD